MAMILGTSSLDPASASIVAKNTLLNGHTAFSAKPDNPTYIVGKKESLEYFYELIPAPLATYTKFILARGYK